jgi:ribosome recycling factor
MEELQLQLEETKSLMQKAVDHTASELVKVRAGKAMPNLVDGIMVNYYGSPTPLAQVASVTTPDARTLAIKPWEKNLIGEISKAIVNSDLGLAPQNNGEVVLLTIPPLTEERRKHLVKQAKMECENGKISLRTVRKDTMDALKQLQKDGLSEDEVKRAEEKVQKLIEQYSTKIDELLNKKEVEIMTV